MRLKLSSLVIVFAAASAAMPMAAAASGFTPIGDGIVHLAQAPGDTNSRSISRDRNKPRQRYVCVVPPQQSSQGGANVCRASEGRIGGTCRCPGTVGSGRLQFD